MVIFFCCFVLVNKFWRFLISFSMTSCFQFDEIQINIGFHVGGTISDYKQTIVYHHLHELILQCPVIRSRICSVSLFRESTIWIVNTRGNRCMIEERKLHDHLVLKYIHSYFQVFEGLWHCENVDRSWFYKRRERGLRKFLIAHNFTIFKSGS